MASEEYFSWLPQPFVRKWRQLEKKKDAGINEDFFPPQSQRILCGCVQSEEDDRNILYEFLQWSVVLAVLRKWNMFLAVFLKLFADFS